MRDLTSDILQLILCTSPSLPKAVEGGLQAISEWEDFLSRSYYKLSQKQSSPVIASGAKQSHKTVTRTNGLRDCFVGKNTLLAMTEKYF